MTSVNTPVITPEALGDAVKRLSALPPLEYEKAREVEAKKLSVRLSVLDEEVAAARKKHPAQGSSPVVFPEVALWSNPVDGNVLLTEIAHTIQRFIVCDKDTAIATALWCAFTWVIEYVQVAPLAVITAPEKRCGKTQLLNLMGRLVCKPLMASNISPSATYRVIEACQPTLLIDEADSFFKDNEELRGVINSGHTRQSAYVIRNVGETHEPKQFSTWGAKAISGIGTLSDTIMDRAIILTLRRKLPHESVERLRHADAELFETLASKLARFAQDAGVTIAQARPSLPGTLHDRAQDNWEPLFAVADFAGGEWPKIARAVASRLSGAEHDTVSFSAELLADIRDVFDSRGVERICTADLLAALCADDEKSWATYNRGKPISPRQFAKRLAEYSIRSKTIRLSDNRTPKGYERAQFEEAFTRYITPPAPRNAATAPQGAEILGFDAVLKTPQDDRCGGSEIVGNTKQTAVCGGVADKIVPHWEQEV